MQILRKQSRNSRDMHAQTSRQTHNFFFIYKIVNFFNSIIMSSTKSVGNRMMSFYNTSELHILPTKLKITSQPSVHLCYLMNALYEFILIYSKPSSLYDRRFGSRTPSKVDWKIMKNVRMLYLTSILSVILEIPMIFFKQKSYRRRSLEVHRFTEVDQREQYQILIDQYKTDFPKNSIFYNRRRNDLSRKRRVSLFQP